MSSWKYRVLMSLAALFFCAGNVMAGFDTEWAGVENTIEGRDWFFSDNWSVGVPTHIDNIGMTLGRTVVVNNASYTAEFDTAEMNSDSRLFIQSDFSGTTFTNEGRIFVLGSGFEITLGSLDNVSGPGVTNFFLDANGVSAIELSGMGVTFSGTETLIGACGFTLLDYVENGTFTLYKSATQTLTAVPTLDNDALFEVNLANASKDIEISFNTDALTEWDMSGALIFSGDERYDGWRKVGEITEVTPPESGSTDGGPAPVKTNANGTTDLLAEFLLDGLTGADLVALQNYLESGMPSNMSISFDTDFETNGKATIQVESGYNIIGWGLTAFNSMFDSDVQLKSLTPANADADVPEPATWVLLLLSGLGLAFARRCRK